MGDVGSSRRGAASFDSWSTFERLIAGHFSFSLQYRWSVRARARLSRIASPVYHFEGRWSCFRPRGPLAPTLTWRLVSSSVG